MNRLSVRSPTPGITIDDQVTATGVLHELRSSRLIILIHGYQNSVADAAKSYGLFRAALRSVLWIDNEEVLGSFWEFHWPGDHPSPVISMATYAVRVPEAKEAGRLLADYLDTLHDARDVVLVAHSLGCRVALHAATLIHNKRQSYNGPLIGGLFLMAAAVPVDHCHGQAKPYRERAVTGPEVVFHSLHDKALGRAFDSGQKIYGESGDAVGRRGEPAERWLQDVDTGLGHGKYWRSFAVAEVIGQALGRAPAHHLLQLSLFGDEDELLSFDPKYLPEHHLRQRRILG